MFGAPLVLYPVRLLHPATGSGTGMRCANTARRPTFCEVLNLICAAMQAVRQGNLKVPRHTWRQIVCATVAPGSCFAISSQFRSPPDSTVTRVHCVYPQFKAIGTYVLCGYDATIVSHTRRDIQPLSSVGIHPMKSMAWQRANELP